MNSKRFETVSMETGANPCLNSLHPVPERNKGVGEVLARPVYLAAYTPTAISAAASRKATPRGPDADLIGDSLYLPRHAVAELLAAIVETALNADNFAQVKAAIRTATDAIVGAAALSVGRNVNLVRKGGGRG